MSIITNISVCDRFSLRLGLLAICASSSISVIAEAWTGTTYVGSHFEVRDHDQATKYIFNGATRVASITGSLSTNLRTQRIRVYAGWNLISLAVTATNIAGQLAQTVPTALNALYKWTPLTGKYSSVVPGESMSAGSVLWIEAETNGIASIVGSYSDPIDQQVAPGGSYLSGSGLEAWTPLFPPGVSAWFYDAQKNRWLEQLAAPLAVSSDPQWTLAPGQAMFLNADTEAVLTVPDPALRIRYYHQDHLGSSSVITDQSGNLVEESAFYPFGHARNESQPRHSHDPYQFEQKERDLESGLSYFNSRFLDSSLARFTRVDPLAGNPPPTWLESPQNLNPYSYVVNNPLKLVDPTGKGPQDPDAQKAKTQVLVMYGNSQFQDFNKYTHNTSRAYFEQQLKATYAQEGGKNADYVVVDISKMNKDQFNKLFKGSSYDVVVYDGHGSGKQKIILPEGKLGYLTPDDLSDAVKGAKSGPKQFYFYGCNTAASGFARQLSEDLPETEITGSGNRIAPWYTHGKHPTITEDRDHNITFKGGDKIRDVRQVDASKATLSRD